MSDTNDIKIRLHAYHIWERERRPEGREREHWDMAARELRLRAGNPAPSSESRKRPGKPDANRAAGGQGYAVAHFAKKHGITRRQAKELIDRIGNDRDALNAAAVKLKPKGR